MQTSGEIRELAAMHRKWAAELHTNDEGRQWRIGLAEYLENLAACIEREERAARTAAE